MNNSLICLYNNAPKVSIYIYYVSSYVIITTSKYYIYPLFEKVKHNSTCYMCKINL